MNEMETKRWNDLRWAVVSLWALILVPAWVASCLDPRPIPNAALVSLAAPGGGGDAARGQPHGRTSPGVSAEGGAGGTARREEPAAGRFLGERTPGRPCGALPVARGAADASQRPAATATRSTQRPISPFGWLILDAALLASGAMLGEAARLSLSRQAAGKSGPGPLGHWSGPTTPEVPALPERGGGAPVHSFRQPRRGR